MGYDVHITRAEHWLDSEENPILKEEFIAYVRTDKDLKIDSASQEIDVFWRNDHESIGLWLSWTKGRIYSKSPDRKMIEKMIVIARALKAQVIGDDGEIYSSPENFRWPQPQKRSSLTERLRRWLSG